jgi:glycosyltransferase involved in cell wall biosynthesis
MDIAITVDPERPVPPRLYGGIERIADMLICGLTERGHEVTLYAHADSDVPCRLRPYPAERSQHPIDLVRNTLHVSKMALSPPDLIHSFGRLAYLATLLPMDVPKIMSYQREPSLDRIEQATWLAKEGSLIFTGCSEHIAAQIRPQAPAYAIYNGVPLDAYDFKASVEADAPLVFLGRIQHIKGTHLAVEIAQRTSHSLVIAGNVPDADEHQRYFREKVEPHLDGDQIRYVGPVDDEEKNDLLGRAAAFLMPIDWEEPFGIVMAEAMACGTLVIGTRRGSVPEVVEHGVTGFVCDDVDAMVEAVRRIDTIDRADVRARFEEHFSDRAIVDAYETLYRHHVCR